MISEKPWKLEAVGRLCLCIIGTWCMGMLLSTLVVSFLPGLSKDAQKLIFGILTVCLQIANLGWIAFFLWEGKFSWSQAFGFASGHRGRAVALGAITAVVALPLTWGLQQFSLLVLEALNLVPKSQDLVEELQNPDLPLLQQALIGFMAIFIAPIVEECVFRGILYPTIKQLGYPKLALLGTSILFGAFHVNLLTLLPLTFLGMVLIYLYERTDNLLAPIAAHSVFNAINFLLLIFLDPISRLLDLK